MHEAVLARPIGSIDGVRRWWNGIDKVLFWAIAALIMIGVVLCSAAGPVAAMRLDIENPFHFGFAEHLANWRASDALYASPNNVLGV